MARSLAGVRVLVVEDNYFVAQIIDKTLRNVGCVVLGPLPRLTDALDVTAKEACDMAVLNIDLGGRELGYPVAEILSVRKLTFLFITITLAR
jgi:two-component SAPR family response regulator